MKIAPYEKLKTMKIVNFKIDRIMPRASCSGNNHVQSNNTWYEYYDDLKHQFCRSCVCGSKTWYGNTSSHSGGGADCCHRAYCSICDSNYGSFNSSVHSGPYSSSYSSNGSSGHTWTKKCDGCQKVVGTSTAEHGNWSEGVYRDKGTYCDFVKACGACGYEKSFGTYQHSASNLVGTGEWSHNSGVYCMELAKCPKCGNKDYAFSRGEHIYDGTSKYCTRCNRYDPNAPVFPKLSAPSISVAESAVSVKISWSSFPRGCKGTKIRFRKKGTSTWQEHYQSSSYGNENAWVEFIGLTINTYYEYQGQNIAYKKGDSVTQTHADSDWTSIGSIKTLDKPGVISWDTTVEPGAEFKISANKWYQVQRVINSWRAIFGLRQYSYYTSGSFPTNDFTMVRPGNDVDHRLWNQMISALREISELPAGKIPDKVWPGDYMVANDFNDLLSAINYMRTLI